MMRSSVPFVITLLRIKVITNRLWRVVPEPKTLFQDKSMRESCLLKEPASPCMPIGMAVSKIVNNG